MKNLPDSVYIAAFRHAFYNANHNEALSGMPTWFMKNCAEIPFTARCVMRDDISRVIVSEQLQKRAEAVESGLAHCGGPFSPPDRRDFWLDFMREMDRVEMAGQLVQRAVC